MTDAAPASVEVHDLAKRYGETVAIGGVSFSVEPGELFGLIGPDGAGKTTLFRILVTVLLADAGTATLDGLDVVRDYREIRRRVGYMPGRFSLYPDLTVRENIEFFASVFGTTVEAEYDLIAPIYSQIEPFADRRAGALSGGMKQKLALSCALVHRPRVLILDEPTTGVDAVSRGRVLGHARRAPRRRHHDPRLDGVHGRGRALRPHRADPGRAPPARARHARGRRAELRRPARPRPRLWRPRRASSHALRGVPGVARADVFGEWVHVTGALWRRAPRRLRSRWRRGCARGWVGRPRRRAHRADRRGRVHGADGAEGCGIRDAG